LGVNLEGDQLRLKPRLPKHWKHCKIHYRYRQTVYHITVTWLATDSASANQLFLDGEQLATEMLPLLDDRGEHFVELKLGARLSGETLPAPALPAGAAALGCCPTGQ
jgi:cellobiose phosphorylase